MKKIYIVSKAKHYANWMNGEVVDNLDEADIVVFTGGEDVTPSLYNEPKNPLTHCSPLRDSKEASIFNKAYLAGKHIIGICRGSQFTCVMSGGRLIQHQINPSFIHEITTHAGTFPITSTHHQAMYPYDMNPENYKVLAWTEGLCGKHENGDRNEISDTPFKEVEICYFPKTKVLGIQGHPEMMEVDKYPDTFTYLQTLLNAHLKNEL